MIPSRDDLLAARRRLRGLVFETPVVELPASAERGGPRLLLKLENRQRTRSFKPRGAFNAALVARERGPVPGLITFSSGNHGQAVALAAREIGVPATVVAPEDVRASKLLGMETLGARVVRHGLTSAERMARARELAAETGFVLVPPYDSPDVICGQSTAGQEIAEQVAAFDAVVVPVGGGGLISGTLLALPGARVVGVEPDDADDAGRSWRAGTLLRNEVPSRSACDGLRNTCIGDLPWAILRERVADMTAVSDAEVAAAVTALHEAGLGPVEPSGAASVAAVLAGRAGRAGETLVALVSGGNAD